MISSLVRKLENFTVLTELEKHALRSAVQSVKHMGPHEDFLNGNSRARGVSLMVGGIACRYKLLADGRRQIIGYMLPGDTCDLRVHSLRRIDHSICTISASTIAHLSSEALAAIMEEFPGLARALWWSTLVDQATTREWIVNVGRRAGHQRVAHLLCEVFFRFDAIGLATGNSCDLPMTQQELADTVALSPVHVNRILRELRDTHLIVLREKRLTILDDTALRAAGTFDSKYLHLPAAA